MGGEAKEETRVYFTGGVTAVLHGWRPTTIDLDIRMVPESDALLRAIPELKEKLHLNVELASPEDFIPALPGWEDRSPFIAREGKVSFHHYDFYSQALSKLQRGHRGDLDDVARMLEGGLVDAQKAPALFESIVPELYRDPASFRRRVEGVLGPPS